MSIPAARLQALHQQIQQGRAQAVLPELGRLHHKDPRNSTVLALQGEALRRMGQKRQAGRAFRQAAILSGNKVYWTAAGTQLADALDFDEALECLRHALAENPDDTGVLDTLIHTLIKAGRQDEGSEVARRQLTLSNDPSQLNKAAHLLMRPGSFTEDRFAECAAAYRRVDQLAPDDPQYWGPALTTARYVCDWDWCESLQQRIRASYARGDFNAPREAAFWNLSWCDDEAINLETTRAQLSRRRGDLEISALELKPLAPENRRLRVGYLSSDFCDHATLHLMAGVFEHHDRGHFEIFAYDYSQPDDSDFRKRFLAAVEHHVSVNGLDDAQVAARIAADQLDLLLDLKLYTKDLRPNIVAHRPAPLIAAYLGFPGSAATADIDYVICDRFVTPDSSAPFYVEKFCRLPHTYQCNDRKRLTAAQAGTRTTNGLPEDGVVFADFNQAYKIDRGSFAVWMRVLADVPGSVLWLLRQSQGACDCLLRHAGAAGIDPARIVFAPPVHAYLHRARLSMADAVLDTLIYNGHTSSADALWAGVPVVTARGRHFASRVSESLLNAIGLPELVGHSPDDMAAIAVRIGTDSAYRQELRQRLQANRLSTPLFDTARFTRDFETAIQMMVERQRKGLPPDHMDVPDAGPLPHPGIPQGQPRPAQAAQLTTAVLARRQRWAPIIERVITQLRSHYTTFPTPSKPLWIDLGCGEGELLMGVADAGFRGIGLDTDEARVNRLQQQGCKVLATPELATGFLSINFTGNISVISLMAPLPGSADLGPVLDHAAKALHPGGVLVLGLTAANPKTVATMLSEHGFDIADPGSAPDSKAYVTLHAVRRAPA